MMVIDIKKTILILALITISILLPQSASALNTFYTTQSSNATFETAQAESDLRSGLVGHWSFNTADKSKRKQPTDKSGMQNQGIARGGANIKS